MAETGIFKIKLTSSFCESAVAPVPGTSSKGRSLCLLHPLRPHSGPSEPIFARAIFLCLSGQGAPAPFGLLRLLGCGRLSGPLGRCPQKGSPAGQRALPPGWANVAEQWTEIVSKVFRGMIFFF